MPTPANYEAWYHTPRGAWIAQHEFVLLYNLLQPAAGARLLDVGTGTGHFARRFAACGLQVSGLDPDAAALDHARTLGGGVTYLEGDALALPFAAGRFDYCAAVTSLCFVATPARALSEMWRVARRGIVLGLLHRHSLLYRQKAGRGAYRGARWDSAAEVQAWVRQAGLQPASVNIGYAISFPSGHSLARGIERLLPSRLPWGGFLGVCLHKKDQAAGPHP